MEPPNKRVLDQSPAGITQTNKLPFLVGVIVFVLLLFYFMYKTQTNQKQPVIQTRTQPKVDISAKEEGPSWLNENKYKDIKFNNPVVSRTPKTVQEVEKQEVSNQEVVLKQAVVQDRYAAELEIEKLDNKTRIEEKKLEIEAMKSGLNIEVPKPPEASPINSSNPMPENVSLRHEVTTQEGANSAPDVNRQEDKIAFARSNSLEGDYLSSRKIKPRSPYEIKAGTYLPAAMVTGINSDLPGSVVAQISENIYDTVTGNYVLIPQGSKLVGEYDSKVTYGQSRALVVWNRIIFPDGSSINLERMQGVDISGYTGFKDKLDNHYLKIYGNALLLSLMGAGYEILNKNPSTVSDPRESVAAAVGQKMADLGSKSLDKNMDVQPTITIRPGYKFKVVVMKDMVLERISEKVKPLSYLLPKDGI